ncbi:MAG: hypothetical protein CO150_03735 [Nitrospirae bacterium CG_4_9_14_3_um_filter_53_35]|nr:MAG: hypothetical protein CO150_03735 [Nitrospirae bacterium CG_4_9_14_3_um_filter_53_35]
MPAKKKKSPLFIIFLLILLCIVSGILYISMKVFSPVKIAATDISTEAAESCQAKITKMLIDETLAFNFKKTKDISFTGMEINSWVQQKLENDRVFKVYVQLDKDRTIFSGLFNPFISKTLKGMEENFISKQLRNAKIAFRIVTKPAVRSNQIVFEPEEIFLGDLRIPPQFMPEILNDLDINPFEKQIRTIKEVHIIGGSLIVTVYAD